VSIFIPLLGGAALVADLIRIIAALQHKIIALRMSSETLKSDGRGLVLREVSQSQPRTLLQMARIDSGDSVLRNPFSATLPNSAAEDGQVMLALAILELWLE
jgi:hypothetical protein